MLFVGSIGSRSALKSANDDPEADLLHAVIIPIFPHKRCNRIHNNTLTRRMVCAGYKNPSVNKGVCYGDCFDSNMSSSLILIINNCKTLGDSGSPLVYNGIVYGIASFVVENEPCGKSPQVFGRVTSIRNWIKQVSGITPP